MNDHNKFHIYHPPTFSFSFPAQCSIASTNNEILCAKLKMREMMFRMHKNKEGKQAAFIMIVFPADL